MKLTYDCFDKSGHVLLFLGSWIQYLPLVSLLPSCCYFFIIRFDVKDKRIVLEIKRKICTWKI